MRPHRARRRFGQNFLIDAQAIERIVDLIGPGEDEHIVEIGPGRCALTDPLAARAGHLSVVEIDRDLGAALRTRFDGDPRVSVHVDDALRVDFSALVPAPIRIVGNLPYNISTPLILHLLTYELAIRDMTFMLQKEVVDRLAASPGAADYGRLSVMVQSACAVEACFEVPPEAFDPVPKVTSRLVRITPQNSTLGAAGRAALGQCVRTAFSQRRKTLRNTLGKAYPPALLEDCGINLGARPGDISVGTYIKLASALAKR